MATRKKNVAAQVNGSTNRITAPVVMQTAPAPVVVAHQQHSITLPKEKDCKHVVKYAKAGPADPTAVLDNIYIGRHAFPVMPEVVVVTLTEGQHGAGGIVIPKEKDCKGSVKYTSPDIGCPITSVYVNRTAFATMPDSIRLVLSAAK